VVSSLKPLLIYDGKCGFCKIWLDYWRKLTGERIAYAASQDVGGEYPQIPREEFSRAVQLVRPDGSYASGAAAVFESLGHKTRYRMFAPVWEFGYGIIARHRDFFYFLTKWTFGTQIEPARFAVTQWIFVRLLAAIYGIAFGSLIGQIRGLIGANGILPAADYLKLVAQNAGAMGLLYVPTLFWTHLSDRALVGVCWAGVAVAAVVFAGYFQRAGLAILFVLYLSLSAVGQDFLSFQWDALLIEVGFLSVFLGHARVIVWLFRALLFRLMFLSGAVKLLSRDPSWRNFTAMSFHYWTQPLPNRISWYMTQLPEWFQKMSTGMVLGVELAIPFLIFAPRRIRIFGGWCLLGLQLLIFSTGNYTFFNLLAMALCVFLWDDRDFEGWLKTAPDGRGSEQPAGWATRVAAVLILGMGMARIVETFTGASMPVLKYTAPFEIVNSYGLFAVMTTERPEIVVEGSMDGETWEPYSFRYKPGDVGRAPRWVAPYQPRLDWQMWFAALGNYRENPWFVNFAVRLLRGSPEVRGLLEAEPFHGEAPRYIRAELFAYSFTDAEERKKTGNWWKREARGLYLPAVGLRAAAGK
jgi:predicted DCC family thiol-disulfide oxidoreductase YuxK